MANVPVNMDESMIDPNLENKIQHLKKLKEEKEKKIEPLKKRINPLAEEEFTKFNSQFQEVLRKKSEI